MLRENNLCLLANLCVYKSMKHYNPSYIYKSNKFYYIPKFFPIRFKVKFKFNIYIYTHIYIYNIYIYIPVQTLLVSISGTDISTKILFVVHIFNLIIMTYLKMLIGIKSLNTKQFSARLSPPPVKLSSFIGVKSPSKKRE